MTTLGFFWMALWAFCLGYTISSMIQVFLTRERMQRTMGIDGPRAIGLAAFFGFISSSCSFAALSSSRALFQKGAGLVPALAFLLASTNLVIELGILIAVFLSWHFVVGEYLGGVMLIGFTWLFVRLLVPKAVIEKAREHAQQFSAGGDEDPPDWKKMIRTRKGWAKVGHQYFMEWGMVWKDVAFGFTVAGVIAAFVPPAFFETLFVGSGGESDPSWWQIALHTLIGPVAAFFTFIGSMGNIPLAAILFGSGVSFAGIMAFIFSDLVVFPVLRISAKYFGWWMAMIILGVFLASLVATSILLHYGFGAIGLMPDEAMAKASRTAPGERFKVDYTFFLNIAFLGVTGVLFGLKLWLAGESDGDDTVGCEHHGGGQHSDDESEHGSAHRDEGEHRASEGSVGEQGSGDDGHDHGGGHDHGDSSSLTDKVLRSLAFASFAWLVIGAVLWFIR